MGVAFYGLNREPFNITPDPEFLFLGESHKQALGSIIHGIRKRKGFIAVTGDVGVGKTTVVRSYLEQSRGSNLKSVYVFDPNVSFVGLLRIIYRELGLEAPDREEAADLVHRLHLFLIEEYRAGHNVALIVDEAQNMPVETLEKLRMLSNLETVKDKLIQIVLIGQVELDDLLEKHELRQLKQRIAVRTAIGPLTEEESEAYVHHRLAKAGLTGKPVFDRSALRLIIGEAKGVPRTINILCDNALVTGFGYQKRPVTRSIVAEVIADFKGAKESTTGRFGPVSLLWKWGFPLAGVVAAVCLLVLYGGSWFHPGEVKPSAVSPTSRVSKETVASARPSSATASIPAAATPPGPGTPPPKRADPPTAVVPGESARPQFKGDVVREVARGDTLSSLVRQVYDENDRRRRGIRELQRLVKDANPGLTDTNYIRAGKSIVFPGTGEKQP